MNNYNLSKSKLLSYFQCKKKIWLEIHNKEKATPIDQIQQAIYNQGHYVGEIARNTFRKGVLIDSDYQDVVKGIKITQLEMNRNPPSNFEAFFQYNDVVIRPDILVNNGDGSWDLIEVKSSTMIKPESIIDVAIQNYVIIGAGVKIRKSYLMYLNRECIYPNLNNLFILDDLTDRIKPFVIEMDNSLKNIHKNLNSKKEPNMSIGRHCKKPYNCHFENYCWKNIPEYSVFNIPRMNYKKKEELYKDDIIYI